MASALEGIRVIDLTVWFQGPVAAQHLADFGAEVIKVERPKGGDQGRGVRSIKALPVGDWNQYFLVINRNKKSMALDLKTRGGTRDHVPPGRAVGRVPLEPRRRQPRSLAAHLGEAARDQPEAHLRDDDRATVRTRPPASRRST